MRDSEHGPVVLPTDALLMRIQYFNFDLATLL